MTPKTERQQNDSDNHKHKPRTNYNYLYTREGNTITMKIKQVV